MIKIQWRNINGWSCREKMNPWRHKGFGPTASPALIFVLSAIPCRGEEYTTPLIRPKYVADEGSIIHVPDSPEEGYLSVLPRELWLMYFLA